MPADTPWWREAVIYEIYIRSMADADGDGVGDIAGIRSRLPYLRDLGVDALWITPWYPSPMADGGYDVTDYQDIDPLFGTLGDAESLIREVHDCGMRLIIDLVPNHTSHHHRWFRAALAAGPGSPERERYVFRDGKGSGSAGAGSDLRPSDLRPSDLPSSDLPPNDWKSVFGGSAWTQVTEPDGRPGQWYLHLFAPEQPDLNWEHPDVRAEFEDVLRFWLDRGVDGFRIDVAHGLMKHPDLPDMGTGREDVLEPPDRVHHPHWDRDGVHDIYRAWRRIADTYPDDRVFVAEAWVAKPERLARYVRPDELQTAFNFDFLRCSWDAGALRSVVDTSLRALRGMGAPATWVLSNHDVTRHVTRYGRPHTTRGTGPHRELIEPPDLEVGTRRARAALLLMLALPGSAYVYQGEELGLEEVEDLPDEVLQDPTWVRSGHTIRGRDGCRVPLPWSGSEPPFGFGPDGTRPWLPQPSRWRGLTAEAQADDPDSMLNLYRYALRTRRAHPALGDGTMSWVDGGPPDVLVFRRDPGLVCVVNLSDSPYPLPEHQKVLLSSEPLQNGKLPRDTAAWLET